MRTTDKKTIREKLLKERSGLAEASWRSKSRAAQQRILELPQWRRAQCVLLYAAFRRETDTGLLLAHSLQAHKTTLLPRCVKGCNELELAAITTLAQLAPGAYGILEPAPGHAQFCGQAPAIVLLPAVAFDKQGYRLGYGGGYYDRLLASGRLGNALCIGLGFDFQLLDALPTEPWDKPVHAICTEERLVWM